MSAEFRDRAVFAAARIEAHHLLVRAAGIVKVDTDAAIGLARQALVLLSPQRAVIDVLAHAEEPLSVHDVATLSGMTPYHARRILTCGHAAGQFRRAGRGPGMRWTLRHDDAEAAK